MSKHPDVFAVLVLHSDAHNSEYLAKCDERLAWISGFDGSAGTAVVTHKEALLWTDGRYFLQAKKQFSPDHWKLMEDRTLGVPSPSEWLEKNVPAGQSVSVDAFCCPSRTLKTLEDKKIKVRTDLTLLENICKPHMPNRPTNLVKSVSVETFAGLSVADKLRKLRDEMTKQKATHALVSQLDEIAWVLNMRGTDIDYNPLFFSYLLVLNKPNEKSGVLFIDAPAAGIDHRLTNTCRDVLRSNNISIQAYSSIVSYLDSEDKLSTKNKDVVWVDLSSCNVALYKVLSRKFKDVEYIECGETNLLLSPRNNNTNSVSPRNSAGPTAPKKKVKALLTSEPLPLEKWKAVKTKTETEGARRAHIRDGAAKTRWIYWLEQQVNSPSFRVSSALNEHTAAMKLKEFRSKMDKFAGLSFPAISSVGSNAAVIHYHADEKNSSPIDPNKIYLIDSGAQYEDGTTDTTRTMYLGHNAQPTTEEKDSFTRVLKGVIAISMRLFPSNSTNGTMFDTLARQYLWEVGKDFRHGTGHGVGAYLCVHEGPIGISPPVTSSAQYSMKTNFEVGHLMSNEPGYYEDGAYGIRIENVMTVVETNVLHTLRKDKPLDTQRMLGFETLTRVPIQKKLIDFGLMTDLEVGWLDRYHGKVLRDLTPFMQIEEELKWLKKECEPVAVYKRQQQTDAKKRKASNVSEATPVRSSARLRKGSA